LSEALKIPLIEPIRKEKNVKPKNSRMMEKMYSLEFLGLTFFSFLMGSINGIFSASDNFEDLIEEKLDSLDMWIKKIEKSNKPFHI
jgi:hypothetical protein